MSPETGGCLDCLRPSKHATEARLKSLAHSVGVRKARARAEVTFRTAELKAAADWHWRQPDLDGTMPALLDQPIPPHWHAGIRYACAIISAYGAAALNQIQHPADFEEFLRKSVAVVAETTYYRKLAQYDGASATNLRRVFEAFHQHVCAAMVPALRRLSLEAWKCDQLRLEGESRGPAGTEDEISVESTDSDLRVDEPGPDEALAGESRIQRSLGSGAAVQAARDYMAARGLTATQFGNQFQTTDRTLRHFLKTGKMRRANFEAMAASIGVTVEQLLAGRRAVRR